MDLKEAFEDMAVYVMGKDWELLEDGEKVLYWELRN